jgi:hypothetical protein
MLGARAGTASSCDRRGAPSPLAQRMKSIRLQYWDRAGTAATAHSVRRNGKYSGASLLIFERLFEHLTIGPCEPSGLEAHVNPAPTSSAQLNPAPCAQFQRPRTGLAG